MRNSFGIENTTCSGRPASSSGSSPPHSRRRSTTCWISTSGASAGRQAHHRHAVEPVAL